MLGTKHGNRLDEITEQAWRQLASAAGTAGDTARQAKRQTSALADQATDRIGPVADEAWSRANAALDALAGRRRPLPWAWIVGAGALGVALGWLAGQAARAAVAPREQSPTAQEEDITERIAYVDVDQR
ncbi:Membrane-anchored ribosome-binding protein, inhibits growth in stationary phase, ElaB/YqjD/DUF883 family [Micromonospora pattaloongensis]|uniref:Membrane-anchored ribosome-binding protein, inhibits growth in stationary phase, ElaB/YqjD/DUF883 family n=1 Tax=Micromonospora pattaloongensis TaxID=405436 RepID=A0A1H3SR37_9ACTN|nr:hypothetical protein [Micromonospora pattaloongensis]SDZ40138.1 Membrane-anchored ribosome-binding protein, inhibits growth in stationary phase, ElaB/YqjD/DUF883 family [Micromonospora pattaloongensis]